MTGILVQNQGGSVRMWADNEIFGGQGERAEYGRKVVAKEIPGLHGGIAGRALIAHAGNVVTGQFVGLMEMPKATDVLSNWEPDDVYMWILMQKWYAALVERGLWDGESGMTKDCADEWIIAIKAPRKTPKIWSVSADLCYNLRGEQWLAIGVVGATVLGVAEALSTHTQIPADQIVLEAFDAARRTNVLLGPRLHHFILEG